MFKQNYILVNVVAEGYDQKRFIEFMVRQKSKSAASPSSRLSIAL